MIQINNEIAGCAIVTPMPENNRLTVTSDNEIKNQLNELVDQHYYLSILVDMSNIEVIDSTGLGTLISIFNHSRNNNCKLKFFNLSQSVNNVITMTRINQILDIYSTLDEAIASL